MEMTMLAESEISPNASSWKTNFRNLLAYLPRMRLVKKPAFHPHGISFVVPLKDDERWIKATLLSIMPYADEIIVVDSSDDRSTEIVLGLAKDYPKIRYIRLEYDGKEAIVLALHVGLSVARYRYFWKWDSDLIASDGFGEWRKRVDELDPRYYYAIQVGRVNLKGDLNHQPKTQPFYGNEARLLTISPELRTVNTPDCERVVGDSIWGVRLPLWYKILRWREPFVFHCDIRTPIQRVFQFWRKEYEINPEGFLTLKEYSEFKSRSVHGMSMEELAVKLTHKMNEDLIPYDETRYGKLPKLLEDIK
jgi:glycosyltransferase involved in cell wall biosynthesis